MNNLIFENRSILVPRIEAALKDLKYKTIEDIFKSQGGLLGVLSFGSSEVNTGGNQGRKEPRMKYNLYTPLTSGYTDMPFMYDVGNDRYEINAAMETEVVVEGLSVFVDWGYSRVYKFRVDIEKHEKLLPVNIR